MVGKADSTDERSYAGLAGAIVGCGAAFGGATAASADGCISGGVGHHVGLCCCCSGSLGFSFEFGFVLWLWSVQKIYVGPRKTNVHCVTVIETQEFDDNR